MLDHVGVEVSDFERSKAFYAFHAAVCHASPPR